jgi:hypothetical protein
LLKLCLPNGLLFQKHSSKPKFHPFIITREDGSRVYGGTITFYELIEDEGICNAMQTLQTMYDAEFSSNSRSSMSSSVLLSSPNGSQYQQQQSSLVNNTKPPHHNSYHRSLSTQNSSSILRNDLNSKHRILLEATKGVNNTKTTSTTTSPNSSSSYRKLSIKLQSPINLHSSLNCSFNSSVTSMTSSGHTYSTLKDRLYTTKCICVISEYPFNKSFYYILNTLFEMVANTDLLGISLESHLYNLIYEIPMPLPGKLTQFNVGCRGFTVHMADYANFNDLPLFDYDLLEFFRLLGVANVINLYTASLLEHQILLYSKDYYLLMLVAESLTALFFPFTWLKPYVPIVPASNLHFIDAPVPYIMGFHHRDIDKDFFRMGQRCFVDIDCGTVTCPEDLPEYSDKHRIIKEISKLITHFEEKRQNLNASKLKENTNSNQLSNSNEENKGEGSLSSSSSSPSSSSPNNILQNSQAYSRITQLAKKTGALSNTDEYMLDEETGRLKAIRRDDSSAEGMIITSPTTTALTERTSHLNLNNESTISSLNGSKDVTSPGQSSFNNSKNETSSLLDDTTATTGAAVTRNDKVLNEFISEQDLISIQFTRCIRELFLQKFVQMFSSYEKFVIVPNIEKNDINESWWMNREYSGNFDSKMFLIEQPSPRIPFLSHFIATQMFASFIDSKIMSILQMPDVNANIRIFDDRIKQFRESGEVNNTNNTIYDMKYNENLKLTIDLKELENEIIQKYSTLPVIAAKVHPLVNKENELLYSSSANSLSKSITSENEKQNGRLLFENINGDLLKLDEKTFNEMKRDHQSKKREHFNNNKQQIKLSAEKKDKKLKKHSSRSKLRNSAKSIDSHNSAEPKSKTAELNPVFTQSLLKDCKLKTKRMLVEKMPEVADLGHNDQRISGVEENMLIASLCDLIERMWSHGLHGKPVTKTLFFKKLNTETKSINFLE